MAYIHIYWKHPYRLSICRICTNLHPVDTKPHDNAIACYLPMIRRTLDYGISCASNSSYCTAGVYLKSPLAAPTDCQPIPIISIYSQIKQHFVYVTNVHRYLRNVYPFNCPVAPCKHPRRRDGQGLSNTHSTRQMPRCSKGTCLYLPTINEKSNSLRRPREHLQISYTAPSTAGCC
ncbi:MAG: hypothetical protein DDT19_02420 [Syntrophomonadaceae bacterium]|nr:hypothetical protein [Bacillota bacterium]